MNPFYKEGQNAAIQVLGLKLAAPIMGGKGRQMKDIGQFMPGGQKPPPPPPPPPPPRK